MTGQFKTDGDVRKVKWEKDGRGVNYDNSKEVAEFVEALQTTLNRTIARTSSFGIGAYRERIRCALGWFGQEFTVVDKSSIKITKADRLIAGLKDYQTRGKEMFE